MKEIIEHEHQWESMGGINKEIWYSNNGCDWDNKKRGEEIVFAIFCKNAAK